MAAALQTNIARMLRIALLAIAIADVREIAVRAATAYQDGKYAEAAESYGQILEVLPRSTSTRFALARSLAQQGKSDEALDVLEEAVAFGVRFNADDPAWASLRETPRFVRAVNRMRERTAPVVRSETAFLLDKKLTPENIAYDPKTRAFFVGSMYQAKIIRIAADGKVSDFVPPRRDGLTSVLGMKVDARRRELWAAAGNFTDRPPLEVDDPESRGKGALFRFDADSGKLIAKYDAAFWFNDLVVTPGGDVYTTAGERGIWMLKRGSDRVEPFLSPAGSFFNGIAITPDGKTLFAASHLEGVMRIDIATKSVSTLELPAAVTLAGIDGLYVHKGTLIAIQNGTDPMRVVRAWLDPGMKRVTRFAVLEQEHPLSDFPLTGTIVGNTLYYVARSQLRAFDGMRIWPDEKLKETVVLKLAL